MIKDCLCLECGKSFSKKGINGHIWRVHGEGQNHKFSPWNKGLTKHDHPSILKKSNELLGNKLHKLVKRRGRPHTEESKQKISLARSKNNKGGRCKWYEVEGQKVQGTWEKQIAEKLTELNVRWIKLKTNKHTLSYFKEGKQKSYTPDFLLPDSNVYLEIKGYWWGSDKEKMELVAKQHSNIRIVIIEKDKFQKIMQGEQVW